MERKKTALVLSAVLIVSFTGVMGVWSMLNTTSEMRYAGTPYDYTLTFSNFANTVVFVDFVDDSTLMYRLSYELYPGSHGFVANYNYNSTGFLTSIGYDGNAGSDDEGHAVKAQVRTLNLTLGSNLPTTVNVNFISNCTIFVIFDGAVTAVDTVISFLGDSNTVAYCQLTEDASIEQQLSIGFSCGVLYLDIDLPEGTNGQVDIQSGTVFNIYQYTGWSYSGSNSYQTQETSQPLFHVGTTADVVYAWLND